MLEVTKKEINMEQALEQRFAELEARIPELRNQSPINIQEQLAKFNEEEQFSKGKLSINSLMPDRSDIPILVAGAGAASSVAISEYIQGFIKTSPIPQLPVATIGKIAGGWIIYKLGGEYHELLGAFGGGVLIDGFADAARAFGAYLKPKGTISPAGNGNIGVP